MRTLSLQFYHSRRFGLTPIQAQKPRARHVLHMSIMRSWFFKTRFSRSASENCPQGYIRAIYWQVVRPHGYSLRYLRPRVGRLLTATQS